MAPSEHALPRSSPLPNWLNAALSVVLLSSLVFVGAGLAFAENFWIGSAFVALRLPLAVLLLAIVAMFFRRVRRWHQVVAVVASVSLLGAFAVDRFRQATPLEVTRGETLRVVTFNLLFVNQQNRVIAKRLFESTADVVLLQEVTPRHQAALSDNLRHAFPYQHWGAKHGAFGTAILSKRPLSSRKVFATKGGHRFAQCASLKTVPKTKVCSVHLSSPAEAFPIRLSPGFLEDLDAVAETRQAQTNTLLAAVSKWEDEDFNVILGGDFNTLEVEPIHQQLERRLVDTFRSDRFSIGGTWPHRIGGGPFKRIGAAARIDYIFASAAFCVVDSQVLTAAGSDHAPVLTTLRLPPKKAK